LHSATVIAQGFKRYANGIGGGLTWKKVSRRQQNWSFRTIEVRKQKDSGFDRGCRRQRHGMDADACCYMPKGFVHLGPEPENQALFFSFW